MTRREHAGAHPLDSMFSLTLARSRHARRSPYTAKRPYTALVRHLEHPQTQRHGCASFFFPSQQEQFQWRPPRSYATSLDSSIANNMLRATSFDVDGRAPAPGDSVRFTCAPLLPTTRVAEIVCRIRRSLRDSAEPRARAPFKSCFFYPSPCPKPRLSFSPKHNRPLRQRLQGTHRPIRRVSKRPRETVDQGCRAALFVPLPRRPPPAPC